MARLTLASILLAIGSTLLVSADPGQEAKPSQPSVAELIQQLGSDSFLKRTSAWKLIEKLGIEALPELQEALRNTTDPEVKRRLGDLLPGLERAAALNPTRITLAVANRPIREAVEEIARKTPYRIELAQGNDREKQLVSAEFSNATLWEVLDEICDRWGIAYQEGWYGNDNDVIRLEFATMAPGFTHRDGPFRVSVRQFTYNKQVDFTNRIRAQQQAPGAASSHRKLESLSLLMGIGVEPKLPLLGATQPILTEAVDDQGRDMLLPGQNVQVAQRYYFGGYRSFLQQVQVGLQPLEGARSVRSLKGSVPVTVVSSQKPLVVVDKVTEVKDKTYKEGNVSLRIEAVNKIAQGYQIRMTLAQEAKDGQQDWNWINSMQQRLVLEDAKGNRFPCQSYNFDGGNFNGREFIGFVTFGPSGQAADPVRLTYFEWITMNHSVPFEFKDLPLP